MRTGLPESSGGFMFCRLWYNTSRNMRSGLGWSTDYPAADNNFMTRFEELTPTYIERWKNGDPGIAAVRATDPDIFRCPFLFMTDPGSVTFSGAEIEALRDYLLKGGFLWADDLWGNRAWRYFETEMRRIFPEYSIEEIMPDHKIFSVLYAVEEIPRSRRTNPGSAAAAATAARLPSSERRRPFPTFGASSMTTGDSSSWSASTPTSRTAGSARATYPSSSTPSRHRPTASGSTSSSG